MSSRKKCTRTFLINNISIAHEKKAMSRKKRKLAKGRVIPLILFIIGITLSDCK